MKVLIVDDEPLIRRSLEKIFSKYKWEVDLAEDGNSGLELWQKSTYDLVILDVLMPGLTGPEVIEERGLKDRTKVVLISAFSGDYTRDSIKSLGADIFIEKPFDDIHQVYQQMIHLLQD